MSSEDHISLKDINRIEDLYTETIQLDDPFPAISLESQVLNNVNCNQNVVRSTLTRIPRNIDVLQKTGLPQALFFQPFCTPPLEMQDAPPFCSRCFSFINPFVEFTAVDRWCCPFCGHGDNSLDIADVNEQLNLARTMVNSSMDFPTPTSLIRKKQRPTFLYLLDTSAKALATGYLPVFCNTLLEELNNKNWDPAAKIGFITYDREVHLYRRARQTNEVFHRVVVPDLENIQEKVDAVNGHSTDYLHNVVTYKEAIVKFLQELPSLFEEQPSSANQSALGAAMILGTRLASYHGGRMTIFQVTKPNVGPGKLRDLSTKSGCLGYEANNKTYREIGIRCGEQSVTIDIFLLAGEFTGLANLADAPKHSGGTTHRFVDFSSHDPCKNRRFQETLRHYLTRDIGWNNEVEIYIQPGFRVTKLIGSQSFLTKDHKKIELPVLHSDSSFGFEFTLDKNIPEEVDRVCFQVTLDYMTNEGQHRTRVHTLALPLTDNWVDAIRSIDQQCLIGYYAKTTAEEVISEFSNRKAIDMIHKCLKRSTETVMDNFATALATPSPNSANFSLMPDGLKSIIRHVMALLNSKLFLPSTNGSIQQADDYAFIVEQWRSLPIPKLILFLLPRLFALDQTDANREPIRLKSTPVALKSNSVYLLDTEEMIYLYIGEQTDPDYLMKILGVSSCRQVTETLKALPVLQNPQSKRLRGFIDLLQRRKHTPAVFQVVKDGPLLTEMKSKLSPAVNQEKSLLYNC